jgi:hypothetical protein
MQQPTDFHPQRMLHPQRAQAGYAIWWFPYAFHRKKLQGNFRKFAEGEKFSQPVGSSYQFLKSDMFFHYRATDFYHCFFFTPTKLPG